MTNKTRPFELHNAPPITIELKFGMKKVGKSGKAYPTKLKHFNVVTREKGDLNFEIAKDVHAKLGTPTPKSVPIRLLSDSIEENFALFRGMFDKNGVLGCGAVYGDKKALRRFKGAGHDFEFVEPYEVDCTVECPHWGSGKCDISGILYFRLADHLPRSGAFGAVRVNGTHAQRRIRASLDILSRQTGGILANLPLQICIHHESKRAADGNTYPIPMLSIEPSVSQSEFFEALELELTRRRRLSMLTGKDGIIITDVLASVNARSAILDAAEVIDMGMKEAIVDTVTEALYVFPEDVSSDLQSLPKRKAEMIISQCSDENGEPDVEKIREMLANEKGRKKAAPKKDEFNF